jgi:hypothetical protein
LAFYSQTNTSISERASSVGILGYLGIPGIKSKSRLSSVQLIEKLNAAHDLYTMNKQEHAEVGGDESDDSIEHEVGNKDVNNTVRLNLAPSTLIYAYAY